MRDTHLSLDERQQFERLLAEYANAEMDCVRASGRRHNAMHDLLDFINTRTMQLTAAAKLDGRDEANLARAEVPTGTNTPHPVLEGAVTLERIGHDHTKPIPQEHCICGVCVDTRKRQLAAPN